MTGINSSVVKNGLVLKSHLILELGLYRTAYLKLSIASSHTKYSMLFTVQCFESQLECVFAVFASSCLQFYVVGHKNLLYKDVHAIDAREFLETV